MHNFVAPPLSRGAIEAYASKLRGLLGLSAPSLPVPHFLEFVFPAIKPDFTYDVQTLSEMGPRHGYVDPARKTLVIREDVYDGMMVGRGRDRFTVCHEIGHALLHSEVTLNRVVERPRAFEDPEWQANAFASAILMPSDLVAQYRKADVVAAAFGVSTEAARVRLEILGVLPRATK